MALKCISAFHRSRPPCMSPYSLNYSLQVVTITCSKLTPLRPQNPSLHSLDKGLELHVQTRSIEAFKYISVFTRSLCVAMVELSWHLKAIPEQVRFWIVEHRKVVRGYEGVPVRKEPHKLGQSMKVWQQCKGPRLRNDWLCITYNETMSIYPRFFQIYTYRCLVHRHYFSISVCSFTRAVSIIPLSPDAPLAVPPANQNVGGS